jgi:hypothetical protein
MQPGMQPRATFPLLPGRQAASTFYLASPRPKAVAPGTSIGLLLKTLAGSVPHQNTIAAPIDSSIVWIIMSSMKTGA